MVKWLSYLAREIWTPGVNFKVHLEMQFEHYATRPKFFGLGGISAYSSYNCNSEEYVRFASELCRHYGLEGNTERLSTDPYESAQISNPDFINGTDNWTLRPAEKNSMVVKSHKGYGAKQERVSHRGWTDMTFLLTKRSAEKPNQISQEIKGLTPGKLYSAKLFSADYQDYVKGESVRRKLAVSLDIDNVNMVQSKCLVLEVDGIFHCSVGAFKGKTPPWMNYHRLVFRALGTTAKLTISDWADDANPGGPTGQEILYNFVEVEPYIED